MASTYVNDLRLNELGTGDGSGTWGTTTNTNLELIAEAFGFGTEAITTNANTHSSEVADGTSDPVRNMYIKSYILMVQDRARLLLMRLLL